jgi:Cu-processing system permease protein
MAALALTLALLGSAPTGTVGVSTLGVTVVSLSSLTIFLVPLIALLIAHDAIVGELDRGTLTLLLSYPVTRWRVLAGKFIGHVLILAIATVLGYGIAGLALAYSSPDADADAGAAAAFTAMVGTSVLLGAAFLALGYMISVAVRDPRTAAGLAIGVWLFFVLIYDMALLGILVADQGRNLTAGVLNLLLLANPTDIYRLLNLTSVSNTSLLSGMAGLTDQVRLGRVTLFAGLAAWIAVPLAAAGAIFARRQM